MAAAFLIESGNKRRGATSAEFLREVEEEGIKFNIENTAEDIVNGLFCTYEPPTSRLDQYRAAKAVRKDPTKYMVRPTVPKSILKFKVKKHNPKKNQTPTASEAPSTPANETRDDAVSTDGKRKGVTWRDQKGKEKRTEFENQVIDVSSKYCGNVCQPGEAIADIMSSPTGRDVQQFFSSDPETPGSAVSMASTLFSGGKSPTSASTSNKKVLYDDLGNPIREDDMKEDENRSYFPSTPNSASARSPTGANDPNDPSNGHSNLFCSNIPFMDTVKEGIGIAGVMAASAAVAAGVPENLCNPRKSRMPQDSVQSNLGIYEPDSYDQPASAVKFSRQSTPRRMPVAATPRYMPGQQQQGHTPTNRSYANSDITMGNTTVHHFSGNDTPAASPKIDFNNMIDEMKQLQVERGVEGSSQHDEKSTTSEALSVNSRRSGYLKSPKSPVVTASYIQSLKSPNNTGRVAEMAAKFEAQAARGSIDPIESRHFDGKMNFLPPTPRRNTPASTPVKAQTFDWYRTPKNSSTPRSNNTDAEIREAASSVLETNVVRRRQFALERDDVEKKNSVDAPEERQESEATKKKKSKKDKKSKKEGGFAKKVKKALNPIRKVTKHVESQRIG